MPDRQIEVNWIVEGNTHIAGLDYSSVSDKTLSQLQEKHNNLDYIERQTFKSLCSRFLQKFSDEKGVDGVLDFLSSFDYDSTIVALESAFKGINKPYGPRAPFKDMMNNDAQKQVVWQVLANIKDGKITKPFTTYDWKDVQKSISIDKGDIDPTLKIFQSCLKS